MNKILFFLTAMLISSAGANAAQCTIVTQTEFSATTASALALAKSNGRLCLIVQNKGATNVYVKFDSSHTGTEGIVLVPNGSWEPSSVPNNAIYIKSASGTDTVTIEEGVLNVHQ